ncbi:MAG: hypothetical protein FWE53_03570 [Firmicutes bacterium]|nr:hypothetical protein [Bacillota bacterium]
MSSLEEIAAIYGNEMKRCGMSVYNGRMNDPDTTEKLRKSESFQSLSSAEQEAILQHGHNMRRYGMGMYQERGAAQMYYDQLKGAPPEFVFKRPEASNASIKQKPMLP